MHYHQRAQDSADSLERARINTTSHILLHSDAFPSWLSCTRCYFPSSRPRWMDDEVSPISGWLIVMLLVSLSRLGFLTLFLFAFISQDVLAPTHKPPHQSSWTSPSPLQPPPIKSVWMWCAGWLFLSKQTQQSISPHSQPAKTHIDDTSVSAAAGCPVWH